MDKDLLEFIEARGLSYIEGRAVEAVCKGDPKEAIWFLSELLKETPAQEEEEKPESKPIAQRWASGDIDNNRAYLLPGEKKIYCIDSHTGVALMGFNDQDIPEVVDGVIYTSDEEALETLGYEVRK